MTSRESEVPNRARILVALQAALLDLVPPELRAVAVGVEYPRVRVRFFYDVPEGALDAPLDTESPRELVSLVETLFFSSSSDDVISEFVVEARPLPLDLLLAEGEQWVFLRREAARTVPGAAGVSRPFVLALPRVLVRAGDAQAAAGIARRMSELSGHDLRLEYVGRSTQFPELAELRGGVAISAESFPSAVAYALGLLCSIVYAVTDVRVSLQDGDHSLDAIFAASPGAPTGSRVAGLEWLHAQLSWS